MEHIFLDACKTMLLLQMDVNDLVGVAVHTGHLNVDNGTRRQEQQKYDAESHR